MSLIIVHLGFSKFCKLKNCYYFSKYIVHCALGKCQFWCLSNATTKTTCMFSKIFQKNWEFENKFAEALAEAQGPLLVHIPNKTVHSGKFAKIWVPCMHGYSGGKSMMIFNLFSEYITPNTSAVWYSVVMLTPCPFWTWANWNKSLLVLIISCLNKDQGNTNFNTRNDWLRYFKI